MDKEESDPVQIAKKIVFKLQHRARDQQDIEALYRLVNRQEACRAWRKLYEKTPRKEGGFLEAAWYIGYDAVNAHIALAEKKTKQEIKEASKEAVTLGKRLIHLIEHNASLRNRGYELIPPVEQAAMERIVGGFVRVTDRLTFPHEVEKELDEIQERDFPEFKLMTTSMAYRVLQYHITTRDDSFIERLHMFVKKAEESAGYEPIAPKPNQPSVGQRLFAISTCGCLEELYGSPNFEIVADITTAIFDELTDAEIVKKWWQRRDKSRLGDNSEEES